MTDHYYLHVPFCRQRCPYCKFALTPVFDEFKKKRYIEYVKREINTYFRGSETMNLGGLGRGTLGVRGEKENRGAELPSFSLPNSFGTFCTKSTEEIVSVKIGNKIKTIYFGGGTPSVLSRFEIQEILECFPFYKRSETEITLETNPEDITEDYILGILELGINRISVGIETLNERSLHEIHRSNRETIFGALTNIGSALFCHPDQRDPFQNHLGENDNYTILNEMKRDSPTENDKTKNTISFNIDFILGLPFVQSGETLEGIIELHKAFPYITHTSVYMLEDEEYPKHWKANSISESEMQDEFRAIMDYFDSIGWHHYELSNWAKPGYESAHNRAYWDHSDTRGFGLSAASYEDGARWSNSSSFSGYYKGAKDNEEILTREQIEIEKMMFALRTSGWDIQDTSTDDPKLQELISLGLLEIYENKIRTTKTGIFVLDHIMSELII